FSLLLLAFFLFFSMLPKSAFERHRKEVEAELPLFLRTLGMLLELKIPFHTALETLSNERFAISLELRAAVKEIKRGATVHAALASLAKEFDSLEIKRALSQVLSAYESGGGAESIRKISDDMFSAQQFRMKEFSSRQSLFALLFIAVSTILPTVFLIFSVLGKTVFQAEVDPFVFALTFLVAFPLVSAGVMFLSSLSSPAHVLEGERKRPQLLIPLALSVFLVFLSLSGFSQPIKMGALFLSLLIAIFLFLPSFKRERYREAVEAGLPDALLSVSGHPKLSRLDSILSTMRNSACPPLASELSISIKQAHANVKAEKVLEDLWMRNSSLILRRVCMFFIHLFNAGVDAGRYVSLMAEDIFRLFELRRERQNALSTQKYTLIFGAIILPVVLGNSLSLIAEISKSLEIGSGILETAYSTIPAYLTIYALLASYFISEAESKPSAFFVYFASLATAATIIFYLFLGTTL
ncbi:MAG: type II secretion system F family protein, partial [Candidatus Bilamarchaeaceae archaeon]